MQSIVDDEEDDNPIFSYGDMVLVAGAMGGVLLLLVIIAISLIIFFVRRNRQRQKEPDNTGQEFTFPSSEKSTSPPDTNTHDVEITFPSSETSTSPPDTNTVIEMVEVHRNSTDVGDSDDTDTDSPMYGIS